MFFSGEQSRPGTVYLVGAGPGDPELITMKALRVLRRADVVLYDALANPALLDETGLFTARIDVGKRAGAHAMAQDDINALLLDKARTHATVVRLKGGDPFVFGRGGEELLYLRAHGVPVEVIPGVSSAIAAASAAGVPVTHRGLAGSFAVVTATSAAQAHTQDWAALARMETLVVMMGLRRWHTVAAHLMAAGLSPATPALAVQGATLPTQRAVTATVASLDTSMRRAGLRAPVTIVVGAVAALAACEAAPWDVSAFVAA